MNIIARLEYELAYYDSAVHRCYLHRCISYFDSPAGSEVDMQHSYVFVASDNSVCFIVVLRWMHNEMERNYRKRARKNIFSVENYFPLIRHKTTITQSWRWLYKPKRWQISYKESPHLGIFFFKYYIHKHAHTHTSTHILCPRKKA